jgi:hypothetical protein
MDNIMGYKYNNYLLFMNKKDFIESKIKEFDKKSSETLEIYNTSKNFSPAGEFIDYSNWCKDFLTSSLNEAWEKGEKSTDEKYRDYAERMNKALFKARERSTPTIYSRRKITLK